jgi:hypothetical protein
MGGRGHGLIYVALVSQVTIAVNVPDHRGSLVVGRAVGAPLDLHAMSQWRRVAAMTSGAIRFDEG